MRSPYRCINGISSAPWVRLIVGNPLSGNLQDLTLANSVDGLIDTGSDITFIPDELIRKTGLQVAGSRARISGIGGATDSYPYIALLKVHIDDLPEEFNVPEEFNAPEGFDVYGWERSYALIGRDWLKNYCIKFDGPCSFFEFLFSFQ